MMKNFSLLERQAGWFFTFLARLGISFVDTTIRSMEAEELSQIYIPVQQMRNVENFFMEKGDHSKKDYSMEWNENGNKQNNGKQID